MYIHLGDDWYDWCVIEYEYGRSNRVNTHLHPSKIHAFLSFDKDLLAETDYDDDQLFAVVQSSKEPVPWEKVRKEFVCPFELGSEVEVDYCVVPVDSIVKPLFVFDNKTGLKAEHFCVLPKREWGRFFGSRINATQE